MKIKSSRRFFAPIAVVFTIGTLAGGALADDTVDYTDGETDSTPYSLSTASNNTIILHSLGTGIATQSGVISGAGTLEKNGAGTIELTANNTFSGIFKLTTGTIGIGNNSAFGTSTIQINGGEIRAVNAARTVTNALQLNASFSVGRLTTFAGNAALGADITITANNPDGPANGDSTFSGVISGSRGITIAEGPNGIGTGAIIFGGVNTYTGGTTISSGQLTVSSGASLAAATSALTVNGGTLNLNNAAQSVGTLSGSGGTINLGTGHTLTVTNASNTSFAGSLAGNGSFIKTGSSTLTLTGTNTYAGTTTINAGTLQFGRQTSLYNNTPASWTAANIVVESGATAAFNVGGANEFTASDIATVSGIGTAGGGFKNGSSIGMDTTNAAGGNFTYGNSLADTNSGANVLGLVKLGTG
ncbi:MAG: beta strand repeat-containing protein, partial [Chthoniobacterales bacterium]